MEDTRPNLFSIASVALEKSNLQAALIVINARVGSAAVVETGREIHIPAACESMTSILEARNIKPGST
jgi:hypothetical protein